jgi:L,D-peptidoglycan transpeptidase YkuD (ErfK/YbiS/YcfS/YnhG family)
MITHLHIRATNPCSSSGTLIIGTTCFPCRLGKSGRRYRKREGDGASPIGTWRLEQLFYRSDRVMRPQTLIKTRPLKGFDGWCDAPNHFFYNRHVQLPFSGGHENMWRTDYAYDLVVSTDHNQRPRVRGFGSAIFLHLTDGSRGTEGCIALSKRDLRLVLQRCTRDTRIVI